ncbi:MAG: hypothetical protein NWF01_03865 [Candidatus Bathyarchaeota archaeon]|nr:hypothetical protein [Candidatus Bathyarchaeota archaeon]
MQQIKNKFDTLFLSGSIFVILFGCLTAFIPPLAYTVINVTSFTQIHTEIVYPEFQFSFYEASLKFLICTIGGFIGLFSFFKKKRTYLQLSSVVITTIGLLFPIILMSAAFENKFFSIPWVGFFMVLLGLSLMFSSLVIQKYGRYNSLLLIVPLLFGLYAIYPLFILINFLPVWVFGQNGLVYYLIFGVIFFCHLFLIWGSIKTTYGVSKL